MTRRSSSIPRNSVSTYSKTHTSRRKTNDGSSFRHPAPVAQLCYLPKPQNPSNYLSSETRQVDEYFYSSTLTTFGATITRWYPAGLNLYDCLSRRRTELSLCLRTCTEIFGTSYSSLQIIQRARARPNNTMRIDRLRPIRTAATHVSATCAHSGLHEHTNRALQRRESWRLTGPAKSRDF
jgi:hypothetical protein